MFNLLIFRPFRLTHCGPLRDVLKMVGVGLLCCGLWPLFAAAQSVPLPDYSLPDYALQPGDLLAVTVYQEDELNREVLVRPDGGISFPLAGDLRVAGLSPATVKDMLEERLDQYIPESSVTVAVLQISGNQVFVVGKVNRPGAYPLYRPLDVMQALALAGGAAQFAALDDIRIIRRTGPTRQEVYDFEYSDVVSGRRLEQNIVLVSGDTIVVP